MFLVDGAHHSGRTPYPYDLNYAYGTHVEIPKNRAPFLCSLSPANSYSDAKGQKNKWYTVQAVREIFGFWRERGIYLLVQKRNCKLRA
jgi:hypothetical protein